ncbi:MAG: GNAT family N-acetyltransferase [Eubacteriales bacterium]
MVYELKDTSKVEKLFAGWQETLIYSCLQNVMGKIYVTDTANPVSAFAFVGCFGFFAGVPDRELVINNPDGFVILVPQNEEWSALIEECTPSAKRVIRYAIKKDTVFDREMLRREIGRLPSEYELKPINSTIYDLCLKSPVTADFVSAFESKEQYLKIGRGMVILKDGKIVSGASSYSRYNEGIEIEVDTVESERRKHLATIACSALILKCLDEDLYPSWDAQNMHSVRLAEKLGYEFDRAYAAYEVAAEA